eukprot:14931-Heterococcus_DN1.PRE.5
MQHAILPECAMHNTKTDTYHIMTKRHVLQRVCVDIDDVHSTCKEVASVIISVAAAVQCYAA